MTNAERLRGAHSDLLFVVEDFVLEDDVVGDLDSEDAIKEIDLLHNVLLDEGFSEFEVDTLTAIAVCDARHEIWDNFNE